MFVTVYFSFFADIISYHTILLYYDILQLYGTVLPFLRQSNDGDQLLREKKQKFAPYITLSAVQKLVKVFL